MTAGRQAWMLLAAAMVAGADGTEGQTMTGADSGWDLVFAETFQDAGWRDRWQLDGQAELTVRHEGDAGYLEIATRPAPEDRQLHQSVLWCRRRFEGDLRYVFRARAPRATGGLFYFNSRPTAGSRFASPLDEPRPDAQEVRYAASTQIETYTLGILRQEPTVQLRHTGGATAAAWPAPSTRENVGRWDGASVMHAFPSPFIDRFGVWFEFDLRVVGRRVTLRLDGQAVFDIEDVGHARAPEPAWTPLEGGGWLAFRNFHATPMHIAHLRVYRRGAAEGRPVE